MRFVAKSYWFWSTIRAKRHDFFIHFAHSNFDLFSAFFFGLNLNIQNQTVKNDHKQFLDERHIYLGWIAHF